MREHDTYVPSAVDLVELGCCTVCVECSMAGLHRGAPAAYPRRRARASHQQSVEWSRENENLNKLSALLDRDARQGFYSTKSDLQQVNKLNIQYYCNNKIIVLLNF